MGCRTKRLVLYRSGVYSCRGPGCFHHHQYHFPPFFLISGAFIRAVLFDLSLNRLIMLPVWSFPPFSYSLSWFHIINCLYCITIKQHRVLVSLTVVMAYHIWLIKGVSHSQDKDHFPIFCPFGIVRYLVILSFTNCQPGMGEQSFHKP